MTVRIAHAAVRQGEGRLVTFGLGSCIAIAVHDARARVGGLAHILLPDPAMTRAGDDPAKTPATAVPHLLAQMRAAGAQGPFTAKIAGGASLFSSVLTPRGAGGMGERNIVATRAALAASAVPLVAEEVGGTVGRSVFFDVATGAMRVRSLREGERVL
ncbi:MAG: chemotaxis protein CheD [Gemmatimonadaceae bacterium]|nr:chemotaxis protein CheD [Gemmatimonadaceae bacterium]